ncbi:hypothetical protein [Macrococcus carouselicus]|uniref:Uncharacterized protein n=1 Tax=Macrococcus carouselicus TaxID=69969 RepID=A0A9Q8CMB8_9STAP|nr:hypothetical protein [Macrococcus carouselicus]TDM04051.1 hypothetical protein ERX40_02460 [Macrococcus carouselicus]
MKSKKYEMTNKALESFERMKQEMNKVESISNEMLVQLEEMRSSFKSSQNCHKYDVYLESTNTY